MTGETMQPMPMSPRQSPAKIGNAAVQWVCTRRGRTVVMAIVAFTILLTVGGIHNRDVGCNFPAYYLLPARCGSLINLVLTCIPQAISSKYHSLSSNTWRPYLPHMPAIIHSPFRKPSNTTLQLENGELKQIPQHLKKTTPNFHLLVPAEKDSENFCKTTMSGMILNYPPPTVVNLYGEYKDASQWDNSTMQGIQGYLNNTKYVKDEDLVLIVDGENSWFQLPSDAIIKQYARVLEDANARLLETYGVDNKGEQKFKQSIVFAADKFCPTDDMACKYAPDSVLPVTLYGEKENQTAAERPAKYLNAKLIIGPAKDVKELYGAALKIFEKKQAQRQSMQSVFATMFGVQSLEREAERKRNNKSAVAKVKGLFSAKKEKKREKLQTAETTTASEPQQKEFSIGLDYTHALFQPFAYCVEDELLSLPHDNSTDTTRYQHPNTWTPYLSLPQVLDASNPPFWRFDLEKDNPSPNKKAAYIDKLSPNPDLDVLPDRKTPWSDVPLIQNTYTGSVPAIVLRDPLALHRTNAPVGTSTNTDEPPTANITWNDMWYASHKRALLRNYFRTPQSPIGYHNHLVGGDRQWDTRGGRGGVWTATESVWLPWGEVDGVCGTVAQLKGAFGDSKGVWLHETEDDNEGGRMRAEDDLKKKVEEARKKDEERIRKEEEKKGNEEVERKKQKEQNEKENKDREEKEKKEREKQEKSHEAQMKEIEEEGRSRRWR